METRSKKRKIEKPKVLYEVDSEYNSESDKDYFPEDIDSNLAETNPIAYNNLNLVKTELLKNEPNIIKILEEPLLLSDRAKLLQLYEIYKNYEPSTEQWLELRNNVNICFTNAKNNYIQYNRYSPEQHKNMEKQIDILEKYNPNIDLRYKILQLNTSMENKKIIYNKYKELSNKNTNDDEYGKLISWINWAISIPHNNIKYFPFSKNKLTQFLLNISEEMDKELYGMKSVKEQILLFVSAKLQNPHMKKCSLGLIGSPGVGKTHISRLLSKILDFPFEQISFGGVSSSDFLKGHEYTYIGAQPGEIVKCLKRMKYKNGILFFDEFDKISDNKDICSALLHITDPIQNCEFRDKYLSEITIDLSYLWFIYSMNSFPTDNALKDRIYTIHVEGYSIQDKICIVKDYLFPKSLTNINISPLSIIIKDDIGEYLIKKYTNWETDEGIRSLEKIVNNIVSKIDFIIKHQDKKGTLKGFNISFNINKYIKYPLYITKNIIDILC